MINIKYIAGCPRQKQPMNFRHKIDFRKILCTKKVISLCDKEKWQYFHLNRFISIIMTIFSEHGWKACKLPFSPSNFGVAVFALENRAFTQMSRKIVLFYLVLLHAHDEGVTKQRN